MHIFPNSINCISYKGQFIFSFLLEKSVPVKKEIPLSNKKSFGTKWSTTDAEIQPGTLISFSKSKSQKKLVYSLILKNN